MKTFRPFRFVTLLGLLAATFITSCATRSQVQKIVTDSNAAILARQLNADTDPVITVDGKGKPTALDEASARIDAFIAAHPDQVETAAALRIRQGMLLLTAGEPELAKVAFAQAKPENLHTPRDKTLGQMAPVLTWWFNGASTDAFGENDYRSASNALPSLLTHQSTLTVAAAKDRETEGIRDYVAETRAWIGLRYASALPAGQVTVARAAFLDTVTNYVASLGTNTAQMIECGCKCEQKTLPPTITLELRRCFRAREVLKYAFEVRQDAFGPNPPPLPEPAKSLVKDWP
jgi:hypothetical protein